MFRDYWSDPKNLEIVHSTTFSNFYMGFVTENGFDIASFFHDLH